MMPIAAKVDIPVSASYDGPHCFQVFFSKTKENDSKKSGPYAYSEALKELCVVRKTPCPINFKCNGPSAPPTGSTIRAVITYSKPQDLAVVIRRCSNHAKEDADLTSQHVVRVQHHHSQYFVDAVTGRHSVLVPWEQPAVGTDVMTVLYQFMCFNSCAGSINRRPTQIIFTLELDGTVLGRQLVNLRICAHPGRGKMQDEGQLVPPSTKKRIRRSNSSHSLNLVGSATKKHRSADLAGGPSYPTGEDNHSDSSVAVDADDDDKVYTLHIRGRKMYDTISTIYKQFDYAERYRKLMAVPGQRRLSTAHEKRR